jgi:hypothetical protein
MPKSQVDLAREFIDRYGPPAGEEGPVRMVREVFEVEPDEWQEKVLRAYGRGERRISVASCHGVGKTALASWIVINQQTTRFPQKTLATAPTAPQLNDALLPEIGKWFRKLPEELRSLYKINAAGDSIQFIPNPDESFFSARTSRPEKPEALAGTHSEHMLLIGDEASGIPEPVFEASIGSMSGEEATTILIGNPVRTTGFFYDTHHKLKDMWFTITVGYKDSTRVSADFVNDVARRYGEDSNAFRVRCLGLFPKTDDDTVIPFELVEAAQNRDLVLDKGASCVWALDVARFGGDRNVLIERTNRMIRPNIEVWENVDTMQTAGRVKAKWDETPDHARPRTILVDVIGIGAGVVDRLRELGLPVRGINVSESASSSDRYLNGRAELWWKCREWLAGKDTILPRPPAGADSRDHPAELLATELTLLRYEFTSNGRLKVESKADVKARGFRSPDIADAVVLSFAEDLSTLSFGSSASNSWGSPIRRGVPIVA